MILRRSARKMPCNAISKSWSGRSLRPGPRSFPMSSTKTSTGSRAGHGRGWGKNRYSVVAYYTRDLVYERLGPGLLKELERKSPRNGDGQRTSRFHQWLTEDVGDPLLAQHLHSLVMLQRLALANGHGWQRFLNSVNLVLPKRGDTLGVPLEMRQQQAAQ